MVQSQQVLEWMAEGEAMGEARGRAESLLRVLQARFGAVPADLETAIRAATDLNLLDRWVVAAATAPTLADFRRTANL